MRGKDISNLYYRGIGGKPDLEQYIINNVCTFQLVLSNSKQQVPGERRKKRSNCLQGIKLPVGRRGKQGWKVECLPTILSMFELCSLHNGNL